jgi:hypothetical protein
MAFATGGIEQVSSWPLLIQTSPLVVEPGKTLLVMGTLPIGSMTPKGIVRLNNSRLNPVQNCS